jgi:hypothetical protein
MNEVQEKCTKMVYSENFWRTVRMNDDLIERLGQAQQKVMGLTVENRALKKKLERIEERADVLEELVMDVAADLADGVAAYKIDYRIGKVMQRLEFEDE